MWYELGVYMTKYKYPEIKVKNKSNKFFKGNQDVDMMLEAGKEKDPQV